MTRPRLIPVVSSLAIVVAVYWAYALSVVPLIEPEADARAAAAAADGTELGLRGPRGLEEHFAPGAWELDKPKILESRQAMLLFGDYTKSDAPEDRNKVLLKPCAMIFTPDEAGVRFAERNHRAVILEAPEGALLEFDQPLDLRQAKIGRLVDGWLRGPVVIRSKGKLPGPEDDLRIETSDVAMSEKQLSTKQPVKFRWGANRGSGRGLTIELVGGQKAGAHGPTVSDVRSLELDSVDRIHLEVAQKNTPAAKAAGAKTPVAPAHAAKLGKDTSGLPVEITCRGPFRFVRHGKKGEGSEGKKDEQAEEGADPGEDVAYFRDQVDVWRIHPEGPSDHLSCERLAIYFAPRKKPRPGGGAAKTGPGAKENTPLDIEPQRILAVGNPVVVHAPSQSVVARGEQLEYNLPDGRIVLSGKKEAMLRQGPNEIHAPSLDYLPDPAGRLGQVRAAGPGWLAGQSPDRPDDQLEARWNDQLQVFPDKKNPQEQVISLTGGAELCFRGVGQLAAEQIYFWMIEKPAPTKGGRPTLQPDRMMARKNVQMHHPQLDGAVGQMEVWFQQLPPAPPKRRPPSPVAADAGHNVGQAADWLGRIFSPSSWNARQTAEGAVRMMRMTTVRQGPAPAPPALVPLSQVPREPGPADPSPPAGAGPGAMPPEGASPGGAPLAQGSPGGRESHGPAAGLQGAGETYGPDVDRVGRPAPSSVGSPAPSGRPAPDASPQHFNIVGELLRAQVILRGKIAELSELTVSGQVRLIETETQRPGEQPMLVTGDQLHVVDAGKPYAAVAVTGRLAHFEARGLALNGTNINLNRGTNRLWIDGPGWMDLPMDRDPQGRPVRDAGPLEIHWQDRMNFDGRTIRYEDSVVATSRFHHLRTETLEVTLSRAIQFAQAGTGKQPEIQQILCRGGAYMESRSLDQAGQTSVERIQVGDLAVNMGSGALSAAGPGWVRTVRRGSAPLLDARGGVRSALRGSDRAAGSDARDDHGLTYVGVDFQGTLSGNVHRREMTFLNQVRTVYGPVDAWDAVLDPDKPEELGPRGAVLSCDRLDVAEMALSNRQQRAMELVASGNTLVESATFTARCNRLSYAEAKDLLILEGDGRTDAELFRQERIGAERSRFAARKIFFWPSTNRLNIDSGTLVEFNESSRPKPSPKPAPSQPPPPQPDPGRLGIR